MNMYNLVIPGIVFIALLIFITLRLKKLKQRVLFLGAVLLGIPAVCILWYQWAIYKGKADLIRAT